jgi:DNA topoisomerase-3
VRILRHYQIQKILQQGCLLPQALSCLSFPRLMTRKLVICEKPSVARDIAAYLGARTKSEGFLSNDDYAITWAFGHLLELKEPEDYKKEWKAWKIETLPIVPQEFLLRPRSDKGIKEQLRVMKTLAANANEIICATDAGREGELIFRYLQHFLKIEKIPFKRLWVSSLTEEALAEGFKNLKEGSLFDPLYRAAKCRSEADWIVGINATRYFTSLYGGSSLYSLGRVQTPVLAMIVARDLEIENFVESESWELHALASGVRFRSVHGKFESLTDAESLLRKISTHPLEILEISSKDEKVLPPLLYDLTELQKDMNKRHSLSADATLKAAQSLYEKKHLSYPRTDSKFLTPDVAKQLPGLLEKLRPYRKDEIARLNLENLDLGPRIVNALKVTDHHAIIPTTNIPRSRMSEDETHVYRAVLTRLLAALYPPGTKSVMTVKARCTDEEFKATHTRTVDLGWEILYPKKKDESISEPHNFDSLKQGHQYTHEPLIKSQKTKAPLPYNEAGILQMMETAGRHVTSDEMKFALKDKGLGTPATRASIIETLISRKYVSRSKKGILSTVEGRKLVSLIKDPRLKSAELTAEWEYQLKQIEIDEHDDQSFMKDVETYVRDIVGFGSGQVGLGPCPLCASSVIEGEKGFGCSAWKEGCKFVLWKDFKGSPISTRTATQLLRLGEAPEAFLYLENGVRYYVHLRLNPQGELESEASTPSDEQSRLEQKAEKSTKNIGPCPCCQAPILESSKAYGCSRWKEGCPFVIWKIIAKRKISVEEAKTLLTQMKTVPLEGFKTKTGQDFKASLIVASGAIRFVPTTEP